MENEIIMEGLNEGAVCNLDNSNGNMLIKVAVGAVAIAAGIGVAAYLKKKKNKEATEAEVIETEEVVENDKKSKK